jgi:hypothetical protein
MFKGGAPDNLSERVDEVIAEGMRRKFPQYFPPE